MQEQLEMVTKEVGPRYVAVSDGSGAEGGRGCIDSGILGRSQEGRSCVYGICLHVCLSVCLLVYVNNPPTPSLCSFVRSLSFFLSFCLMSFNPSQDKQLTVYMDLLLL